MHAWPWSCKVRMGRAPAKALQHRFFAGLGKNSLNPLCGRNRYLNSKYSHVVGTVDQILQ
jgi:hypothetical protein